MYNIYFLISLGQSRFQRLLAAPPQKPLWQVMSFNSFFRFTHFGGLLDGVFVKISLHVHIRGRLVIRIVDSAERRNHFLQMFW